MTVLIVGLVVAGSLFVALIVYQQALSRLIFVEAALSSGVPEGVTHPSVEAGLTTVGRQRQVQFDTEKARQRLGLGTVSVFLTATCTSCRRLGSDLADPAIECPLPITLFFDDVVATGPDTERFAAVHGDQRELIDDLGISLFPYAVVVGASGAIAHGPSADVYRLANLAVGADVGFSIPTATAAPPQ